MRHKIAVIMMIMVTLATLPGTAVAQSQLFSACDKNISNDKAASSTICGDKTTTSNPIVHIISITADIIAILAGLAAVVMIIVSGIALIASSGNADKVSAARKRLFNAVIGLALVILAWTIVRFVVDKVIQ